VIAGDAALSVEDVSFRYAGRQVLHHVNLTVSAGRFTALLGENGAGKTTLLSLVCGLQNLQDGRIRIRGRDLAQWGMAALAPLGLVFQQPTLDPDLSVKENLRYFAGLQGLSRATAGERIGRELTRIGIAERAAELVHRLNGGHRRRVEIARALLHDPEVLLLDEPTVGLDVPTRQALVDHVHELASRDGIGVLWATHLIDEVRLDDDVVVLHRGEVIAAGSVGKVMADAGSATLHQAYSALTGASPP
jgi:ABC-2 type transport system ATP-binding protein